MAILPHRDLDPHRAVLRHQVLDPGDDLPGEQTLKIGLCRSGLSYMKVSSSVTSYDSRSLSGTASPATTADEIRAVRITQQATQREENGITVLLSRWIGFSRCGTAPSPRRDPGG